VLLAPAVASAIARFLTENGPDLFVLVHEDGLWASSCVDQPRPSSRTGDTNRKPCCFSASAMARSD
jgi:hypothetical protein